VQPDFSTVRVVVFDLDDTLCGYWDASKQGLRIAFDMHGPEGISVEQMVRHWAAAFRKFSPTLKHTDWYATYLKFGEPTRTEQMRWTLREAGIENEAMAQALSETYATERDRGLQLFEDGKAALDALKGRYPMGLLTNGPADIQRQEIATVGIESYLDGVFIEGEMEIGKPKPEVFRRVEALFGATGEELLMVGNSYAHDIRGAIEVGWKSVWVRRPSDVPPSASGEAKPEERPEDGPVPDMTVGDLREMLPFLRR
jgi:putative hydrolase of the HAD superfamily